MSIHFILGSFSTPEVNNKKLSHLPAAMNTSSDIRLNQALSLNCGEFYAGHLTPEKKY